MNDSVNNSEPGAFADVPRIPCDDPFSPEADPCPPRELLRRGEAMTLMGPESCGCGGDALSLSRRQALIGVGALALLPAMSGADTLPVPCVQSSQKIRACRHKFCRYYGGQDDYHGR